MADKNYVKTKYGTRIDVTGLNEGQRNKVLSMAQDKGAYGGKGANLAKTLQKNLGKASKSTPVQVNPGDIQLNDGAMLQGQPTNQHRTTINIPDGRIQNPDQLMQSGYNFSQINVDDARDANYNYITKDYENQKAQEMEAAKQELAQRGIPMSADPNSLYAKTISNIGNKYQGLYDQANNQAIMAGNETLGARTGAQSAFINNALGIAGQNTGVWAGKNDFNLRRQQLAQARRGGGGGAPADQGPILGGMPPGFNISNG